MKDFGIHPQAWGPLFEGQRDIFRNKLLMKISGKYGKTAAQVILRWHVQRGVAVIPKSVHRERMTENFGAADITLTEEEFAGLEAQLGNLTLYGNRTDEDIAKLKDMKD